MGSFLLDISLYRLPNVLIFHWIKSLPLHQLDGHSVRPVNKGILDSRGGCRRLHAEPRAFCLQIGSRFRKILHLKPDVVKTAQVLAWLELPLARLGPKNEKVHAIKVHTDHRCARHFAAEENLSPKYRFKKLASRLGVPTDQVYMIKSVDHLRSFLEFKNNMGIV